MVSEVDRENGEHFVAPIVAIHAELEMDETTKQVVKLLEQSIALQLNPIHEDLSELKTDFRSFREQVQKLGTSQALTENNQTRLERQLNEGLAAVRRENEEAIEQVRRDTTNRWKLLTGLATAVASAVASVVMYLIHSGAS